MAGSLKPSIYAQREIACRAALTGFPSERLKYVQEGDFQRVLELLRHCVEEMKAVEEPCDHDVNICWCSWRHAREDAEIALARLQPEPEDSP